MFACFCGACHSCSVPNLIIFRCRQAACSVSCLPSNGHETQNLGDGLCCLELATAQVRRCPMRLCNCSCHPSPATCKTNRLPCLVSSSHLQLYDLPGERVAALFPAPSTWVPNQQSFFNPCLQFLVCSCTTCPASVWWLRWRATPRRCTVSLESHMNICSLACTAQQRWHVCGPTQPGKRCSVITLPVPYPHVCPPPKPCADVKFVGAQDLLASAAPCILTPKYCYATHSTLCRRQVCGRAGPAGKRVGRPHHQAVAGGRRGRLFVRPHLHVSRS